MVLAITEILRAVNPNIGLVVNPDGSYRISIEDVNSDEILTAVEAINTALQDGGITQAQLAAILLAVAALETDIVLAAGDNNIGNVDVVATKTIQNELLAITAVAANAQQKSSELALTGIKKAAIFIDHGRTATTAFVGAGTEYRVEASQKASGDDAWVTIASYVCAIAAASEITADGDEAAGQTLIEIGATTPAVNNILFWENATLANSEWIKVVAIAAGVSFTCLDALTNNQAAAKKIYNQGERIVFPLDVEPYTRLRVIVNNNNGTTNVAIKSRVACITEE